LGVVWTPVFRWLVLMIVAGKLYENYHYRTGLFQIMNCQGFQNNHVNLYEFFLLGMQVQTKIKITVKFLIIMEFRINEVLL
jgi:hypothetical protein